MKQICLGIIAALALGASHRLAADLADAAALPSEVFPLTPNQEAAALANQAIFDALSVAPALSPEAQALRDDLEELVHTANEFTGGDTTASLRTGEEGLRTALQWVSHEEVGSQGSIATDILNAQMSTVAARVTALRLGALKVAVSGYSDPLQPILLAGLGPTGGGAGDASLASSWGVFVNGSIGSGDRDQTDLEDALDFDTQGVTTGLDYRFASGWVIGIAAGFNRVESDLQATDRFNVSGVIDPTSASGSNDVDSASASAYTLFESGNAYLSGALTYTNSDYDMVRRITYPSQNPAIPSTNETATSTTDGGQLGVSAGGGYTWSWGGLSLDPAMRVDYLDVTIDGYQEQGAEIFNLAIEDQDFDSLTSEVGVDLRYAISFGAGVLAPQVGFAWNHEFNDDGRTIVARYVADPNQTPIPIRTDDPDRDYFNLATSLVAVFARGWQGFVQYETVLALEHVSLDLFTAGLRVEF